MSFERFFKVVSYLSVFCGFLSLWITGTFGIVESAAFLAILVAAWFLEGSRWQISEKLGTALIVLALPASYAAYRLGIFAFSGSEAAIAGILARMILSLSAIKVLQRKSERDWIFLYLMAFFEVLLAAGLSISLLYLASFVVYMLVMVCTVVAFEMRKTGGDVSRRIHGTAEAAVDGPNNRQLKIRKLPAVAFVLILFIAIVAAPLFFILPRVSGAGLGSFQNNLSTQTGFSDKVDLGGIGQIQQNDAVVMRVKVEGPMPADRGLYLRGVALDEFDNKSWSRAKTGQKESKEPFLAGDRDLIQLDFATGKESLLVQTIYLEPLDTPVLFAVPRAVAIQGNFPILYKDRFGAVTFTPANDRISYKVLSDLTLPSPGRLRADDLGYGADAASYLQLPTDIDPRIAQLAETAVGPAKNRYDKAAAIESYLKSNFGYTLEMKSGGPQPVADFLFNVKEGHCEYFASAMAIMLRTQGIATRIVNGFRAGEYNDPAGMYVVRQRHAHAWVEVFFPKENVWVPFDPTPAAADSGSATSGLLANAGKYLEALDALWIQYFVAFDNQGQRSLARTLRTGFIDYQAQTSTYLERLREQAAEWWRSLSGQNGVEAGAAAFGYGVAALAAAVLVILVLYWLYRRVRRSGNWKGLGRRSTADHTATVIQFYEKMLSILAEKGFHRTPDQTPLEFAYSLGSPEATWITHKYNEVRFGEHAVSQGEVDDISSWLDEVKTFGTNRDKSD